MRKIFTLLLAVMASVGAASASITVRLDAESCKDWNVVYLWAWQNGDKNLFASWPGKAIQKDAEGYYSYTFSSDIYNINIIWSDGINQTIDITNVQQSTCYALNSTLGKQITVSTFEYYVGLTLGALKYNLYGKDNKAEVVNSNVSGTVFIPSSVDYKGKTYSVTSIGNYAFRWCTGLTSVTIPNSVTRIGMWAFYGCSGLTSIEIPNSVTSIGFSAFSGCTGLTSIELPNSVTSIGSYAFEDCTGLTSFEIPNGVESIGDYIFSDCTNLTSLTIGNSVTSLGVYAFDGCKKLNSIVWNAKNCADFKTDCTPFYYKDNLDEVKFDIRNQITSFEFGDDVEYIPAYLCSGMQSIASTKISNSVISIGVDAFGGCTGLTSVTIGNSVESIGKTAFANCYNLSSIEIPNSVTSIGDGAFWGCIGLKSIEIPYTVTSVGDYAFEGCSGLTSVTIPSSVTSIGQFLFKGCTGLTSLSIPNSVTSIENSAFEGCTGLTSVVIPNSVTSIENSAFEGCTGLTSVVIPNSVTKIEYEAFYGCSGLTSVTIPNSVTSIGWSAFYGCSGLTSVTIENGVDSIGYEAFSGCTGLTSIEIPNSVTYVEAYAFEGCNISEPVYNEHVFVFLPRSFSGAYAIPEGIKTIAGGACRGCTGLTSVTIPNSVTSIGGPVFFGCTGLTSIEIPKSITSIGYSAFEGCTGLTSVVIPNSVTSLGVSAFYGCTGLTSIEIPNSVTYINDGAFSYCTSLTSIEIPNSVTSIGQFLFKGCTGLTSIEIPNSIEYIMYEAFSGCTGLNAIYNYRENPAGLEWDVFSGVNVSKCTLYVPEKAINAYRSNAEGWGNFTNIEPIKAEPVSTDDIKVSPSENAANIVWPTVENAVTYEMIIKDKEGNVICTLIFNANGQLQEIAFSAPSRDNVHQQTQAAGFSFTISGLDAGTEYDLTIISKDENGDPLDEQTLSFTTEGVKIPTSLDQITNDQLPITNKVLRNGQLLILHGDNTYTLTGQQVR